MQPAAEQMTLDISADQASTEEALRSAYADVPGLSRRLSFRAALGNPPVRRCLEIMAEIRQRKANRRRA